MNLFLGHHTRLLKLLLVGLTPVALAGCAGELSTLDPAGPAARTIATLWWVMLVGAVAICALVMALLALAFRRRNHTASETGQERLWVVYLGIAFPVAVLLALLVYGLVIGERLLPRQGDDITTVQAEGRRGAWSFSYADIPGRTTENILHIPAGQPVDVAVTTVDVIHSFWVPRLAGKLDAVPGHINVLRIEADQPGVYAGISAEFSGAGYDRFTFQVVAHAPATWDDFVGGTAE